MNSLYGKQYHRVVIDRMEGEVSLISLLKHHMILLLLCTVFVLCTGCVEYSEEIWFKKDMSGQITIKLKIAEMFVDLSEQAGRTYNIFTEEEIQNHFTSISEVRLIESSVETSDEYRIITITLKFDSQDSFRNIFASTDETDFLGGIKLRKTAQGNMSFTRTIALKDSSSRAIELYDENLNQHYFISTIHFPGFIISANAPQANIDTDTNNTVTWAFSLDTLTKEQRTMVADYTAPSERNIISIVLAAIVFLVVFAGLYLTLRKM